MSVAALPQPYKGLAPYDDAELDELLFFGREREREIVVANMLASRLTVVYGPSGVGKTSLLRAGVVRRLRELPDTHVALIGSWAEDPMPEIERAVARAADAEVYLILDQLEEYFVYHGSEQPFARRLPEIVTTPGIRVNVLLGIRDDALAKLDFFKGRIPNLFSNYLRLEHLDRDAARAAIVGPLRRLRELDGAAGQFDAEPALVETLLDQVATGQIEYGLAGRGTAKGRDEPARIEAPFLQLVLERLWKAEREQGSDTLRLATLERLGGAETIVRDHLDRALALLDPGQQTVAAEVFEHLVTPSGTKIAHGLGDLAEYAGTSREALRDVLARLSRERIVRPLDDRGAGGRYEIYHDVLAGGVLAWRTSFDSERELERERTRRRRAVAIASLALLALAAVAAVALYALSQRDRAQREARSAEARELAARALADLTVDPQRSLRLAVAAAERERTLQVEEVLRDALLTARQRIVLSANPAAAAVAFRGDGPGVLVPTRDGVRATPRREAQRLPGLVLALHARRRLALTGEGAYVGVRALDGGGLLRKLDLPGPTRAARFGPGSPPRFVAVVARNRSAREFAYVFRLSDGTLARVVRHRGTKSVAFSPDGRFLATGSADGRARMWRLRDGRLVRTFEDEAAADVLALEFSPDGALLATAGGDGVVRVWRVAGGERRFVFVAHTNPVVALAWSPDGQSIADASLDRTAHILDVGGVGAGRMSGVLSGHTDAINAIAYSGDGRRLATLSSDGTARVWDARTEHELLLVGRHRGAATGAAFDALGERIVSGGDDGIVVLDRRTRRRLAAIDDVGPVGVARFDAGGRILVAGERGAAVHDGRARIPLRHRGAVTDAAFGSRGRVVTASVDGWIRVFGRRGRALAHLDLGMPATNVAVRRDGLIAAAAADGTIRLWRPRGATTVLSGHAGRISALRLSPDRQELLSAGLDGVARVWDAESGALRLELPHRFGLNDAVYSPDGRSIVTTTVSRHVRLWDARTGRTRRDLVGHFAPVNSAAFSADGRWLVTTSAISAALWRMPAGDRFAYLRGHETPAVRSAEFSRDGRHVVTAGDDGTVRVYRCELCGGIDDLVALARARLTAGR